MDPRTMASDAASALMVIKELSEIVYEKYKENKRQKKLADIKKINELHEFYLTQITIDNNSKEKIALPPIFIPDTDSECYRIPTLSAARFAHISPSSMEYTDPYLLKYGHQIGNAISGLKLFYKIRLERNWFRRGKRDDVTSGVLCYLLEILHRYCRRFSGYQVDIALIGALAAFVNAFASLHSRKSERFNLLTSVHADLIRAQHTLMSHSTTLTWETQMSKLVPLCIHTTELMIRELTKHITPTEHWTFIDETKLEWLAQGLITPSHDYQNILGQKEHVREIPILDCSLKTLLVGCAKSFLLSLCLDSEATNQFLITQTVKENDLDYEDCKKIFLQCENYLTTTAIKNSTSDIAKNMQNNLQNAEIETRLQILKRFIWLIQSLISLQYLCSHLWVRIKQFGEIYIEHPNYLFYTLTVLKKFGNLISEHAQSLSDELLIIGKKNIEGMHSERQQHLFPTMRHLLQQVEPTICGKIRSLSLNFPTREKSEFVAMDFSRDTLLKISHDIECTYNLAIIDVPDLDVPEEKYPHNEAQPEQLNAEDITNDMMLKEIYGQLLLINRFQLTANHPYNLLFQALIILKWKQEQLLENNLTKAQTLEYILKNVNRATMDFLSQNTVAQRKIVDNYQQQVTHTLRNPIIDVHRNKFYGLFFKTDTRKKALNLESAIDKLNNYLHYHHIPS